MPGDRKKMHLNAVWSMAVGGMIGGGIFSVLGVVVEHAGGYAWLAFLIGGLIAGATAHSYAELSRHYGGGGTFTFLAAQDHSRWAASVAWILMVGYVLTMAVYAFTFGHYLANMIGLGEVVIPRAAAALVIVAFTLLNLRGIGASALTEIVMVWGKVIVLIVLAGFGFATFAPDNLAKGVGDPGIAGIIVGGATVFMAYEGFQLLAYDYNAIERPERTLPLGLYLSVGAVIAIYICVTLGTASLVGAGELVEKKEVALAEAGQAAAGMAGMIIVSIAAVLSTGSAINATLFATARLSKRVAEDGELPEVFARQNRYESPVGAVVTLGVASGVLAVVGTLSELVEAASLAFLGTFAVVNVLAFMTGVRYRVVAALGALGAIAALGVLAYELAVHAPIIFGSMVALVLLATLGRGILMKWLRKSGHVKSA